MKKEYVKPCTEVHPLNAGIQILSESGSKSITGDIDNETNIGFGGSSKDDPYKGKGGDAKSFTFDKDWDED